MTVALTSLSPPRGRAGAVITIEGSGFSPNAGQNLVEFGVTPSIIVGTVLSETPTVIQVLAPAGLVEDFQTRVRVTNLDDVSFAQLHWFVLKPAATLATDAVPAQQPGPQESLSVEVPTVAEAKDFERLTAFIQSWTQEVLPAADPLAAVGPGASRVGVDLDALDGVLASEATLQGALEAIAAILAEDPVLASDAGAVGNVGGGEDVLHEINVPTGTLEEDGDYLKMTFWGTIGVAAMEHRVLLKLKFGGSSLETEGVTNGGMPGVDMEDQEDWRLEVILQRTGPATQRATALRVINDQVPFVRNTAHTVSLASDVTIQLTGENATDATDNAIIWNGATVEVVRKRRRATQRTASDSIIISERQTVEVL